MLNTPGRPIREICFGQFFDASVLLHRGQSAEAVEVLAVAPEDFVNHYNGQWRAWYASAWAEAAVLAHHPDAGDPVASAIVMRAAALLSDTPNDRSDIVAAAAALRVLGARYQWARTLVMLGGDDRERGEQELAALGATPMASVRPGPR